MNRAFPHPAALRPSRWLSRTALLVGLNAAMARAEPAGTADAREQERTALYREGVKLAEAGNWKEALTRFQQVVAIRAAPAALLAFATAQEKAGQLVEARQTYRKTQSEARAAGDSNLESKAGAALETLSPRIPRVAIRLPADAAGAEAMLDDGPVPAGPEWIDIDPGEHRVLVRAPGKRPFDRRFRVAEAERKDISVDLAAGEPTTPGSTPGSELSPRTSSLPSNERGEAPRSGPPAGVFVLGGAGAAATAVGIIVRVQAKSAWNDHSSGCPDSCLQPAIDSSNAARTRMLWGTVAAGAGISAIAGAGLWWILSASSNHPPAPATSSLAVRADASAAGCSMHFSGTF